MLLFRAQDIPPDLLGYFEPIVTSPPDTLVPKPSPFAGQHYATYPPDLIRPLIRASTPRQCCPACGAGWAAVVEREGTTTTEITKRLGHSQKRGNGGPLVTQNLDYKGGHGDNLARLNLLGYRPTCACGHDDWMPGLVLDPFVGSGTTLEVAREEGLNAIGLDLSFEYLHDQARGRLGFIALQEWEHGKKDSKTTSLAGLPLFEEV